MGISLAVILLSSLFNIHKCLGPFDDPTRFVSAEHIKNHGLEEIVI